MASERKLKIDQILEEIDHCDYYQVLNVTRDANQEELKAAYFHLSRQYHPDKYYAKVDEGLHQKFTRIFKRLNEAYGVLKDSQMRSRYDKHAFGPERKSHLRYQRTEEDREGPANLEDQAKTGNGKKYLRLALLAQKKKDWASCEMNLNFALRYEPDNDFMRKMLASTKEAILKMPKQDPFKIR